MKMLAVDDVIKTLKASGDYKDFTFRLLKETKLVNAIPIPNNATKGDMFQILFDIDKDIEEIEGKDGYMYFKISEDVWNALYQKGMKR